MLVITDDASVEAVRVEVAAPLMTAIERLRMAERERVHSVRHVLQLAEHDEVEWFRIKQKAKRRQFALSVASRRNRRKLARS
jgi:hypothetical protein